MTSANSLFSFSLHIYGKPHQCLLDITKKNQTINREQHNKTSTLQNASPVSFASPTSLPTNVTEVKHQYSLPYAGSVALKDQGAEICYGPLQTIKKMHWLILPAFLIPPSTNFMKSSSPARVILVGVKCTEISAYRYIGKQVVHTEFPLSGQTRTRVPLLYQC